MIKLDARQQLRGLCAPCGEEIHRDERNQVHFLVRQESSLIELGRTLSAEGFYLVTMLANDESELDDHCLKIYYIFSHPTADNFLIIETHLPGEERTYPSLATSYPAVSPFENEIADLFGLFPFPGHIAHASRAYLHEPYPADLRPLRRSSTAQEIMGALQGRRELLGQDLYSSSTTNFAAPGVGEWLLPVGPVHAGVIEPGQFLFRLEGESIEEVQIRLGYTHRGIERLLQTNYNLQDGWKLAEQVSGDSSFVHSLAYCKAVETLEHVHTPEEAQTLRALLLELERLTNYMGDISALAQDIALEILAAEMSVLREQAMRLCQDLTGSRFLRGVNRPGGVILPKPLELKIVDSFISKIYDQFLELAKTLLENPTFRDRSISIGILTRDKATRLGISGLVGKASGVSHDFRQQHPFGPYQLPEVQQMLSTSATVSEIPLIMRQPPNGDVYSRCMLRAQEVALSLRLMRFFLNLLPTHSQRPDWRTTINFNDVYNFEFGIGYAEGWRGNVVYFLMKDKFKRIYRCKVCDPSTLNWAGLSAALQPQMDGERPIKTALVDFPLINKSFDLSYAGNDL